MIYSLTLNPTLDYVMHVGKIRYDDVNKAYGESMIYGGKGINVTAMLTRLGVPSRAFGFVAGFTGDEFIRQITADGVDHDFVRLKRGNTRVNVKIRSDIELDFNVSGPEADGGELSEVLSKLDEAKSGDCIVLSGSIPPNLPQDLYERIMKSFSDKNVDFVVDATGDLLLNSLKYRPLLVKPNHHELGDLFGVKTETDAEVLEYGAKLREMGARNVIVSRSRDGAILFDEEGGICSVGRVEGTQINTVGSGDSVVAGFLAGLEKTGDYGYALRLGAACGSATAFSEGLAQKSLIDEVFDRVVCIKTV